MSRYDISEHGMGTALESQRGGGYDPGTRSHNFFNGMPPPSIPDGHNRVPQSAGLVPGSAAAEHHQHHRTMSGNAIYDDRGYANDAQQRAHLEQMWMFPPFDSGLQVEGAWARNRSGTCVTANESATNTTLARPVPPSSPPNINTNASRVASSISPFNINHTHRATYSPANNGVTSPSASANTQSFALNGNAYPSYLNEFSRDTETLLLQQQAQTAHAFSGQPQVLPQQQQQQTIDSQYMPARSASLPNTKFTASRSTLWWGELEPWMDDEYAKQVCGLMGWDQVSVKIPHVPADHAAGQQANNPGYCFLTFPTPQHAAAVLSQVNNAQGPGPLTMPNSNKSFVLNWASSPAPSPATPTYTAPPPPVASSNAIQQKEFSIFVGDLAPETSNSDLVAVFRNPVLGLRNDRAPKFIRPFYSCKSAKIMLDPVTGVSRGYGFVRFTEEADQQRALIEMHGLYCLSRPMRISPATAKFKVPAGDSQQGGQQNATTDPNQPANVPAGSVATSRSGSSIGSSASIPSLSSSTTASSSVSTGFPGQSALMQGMSVEALTQFLAKSSLSGKDGLNRSMSSITASLVQDQQKLDESWKHQAQARAILGNLIGPNGEQLTSTDPYNTTVFVGGLSPLISEETLRTFFAPFGDIHYVKVPAGKHCGFVQFVRKADAERAIERMQGFPIGGSRIRLSWGRSQYKAAQAAAQAAAVAQAAALPDLQFGNGPVQLTPEQAIDLLQKFGFGGFTPSPASGVGMAGYTGNAPNSNAGVAAGAGNVDAARTSSIFPNALDSSTPTGERLGMRTQTVPSFSPFSPDPNFGSSERGSLGAALAGSNEVTVPRTLSTYGQRFGGSGRLSPVNSTGSARSPTPSQQTQQTQQQQQDLQQQQPRCNGNSLGFVLNRAAPPFQLNRAPSRPGSNQCQQQPSMGSRPSSSQLCASSVGLQQKRQEEQDASRDVGGTFAPLDLGSGGGMNASASSTSVATSSSMRSPGEKSDSSGSVQFRMSMGSPSGSPQL